MKGDADILRELYQSKKGVSIKSLAEKKGMSITTLWARIEELKRIGFKIISSPNSVCRLLSSPDLLIGEDLMARIHSKMHSRIHSKIHSEQIIGRQIQVFRETSSTNEIAERLGKDGVPEGVIVISEHQTRGRGRLGRRWQSSKGKGILMSVLLRPSLSPPQATRLTIIGATAISRAIQRLSGLSPSIKWPNDVMLKGKKVAGILTEMNAEAGKVQYLVLGMGLNVNQTRDDFPNLHTATSLRIILDRPIHRARLAAEIIEELDADYRRMLQGDFSFKQIQKHKSTK